MFTPFGQMLTKTLTLMAPSVYGNYVLCRARHLPLFSHTSPTKLEVHTVSEKNIPPITILLHTTVALHTSCFSTSAAYFYLKSGM